MDNHLTIRFSSVEAAARALLEESRVLADIVRFLAGTAADHLNAAHFQGSFRLDFETRCQDISRACEALAAEVEESGLDLNTAAQRFAQMDQETAARFNQSARDWIALLGTLPLAAGASAAYDRWQVVNGSIASLTAVRGALYSQIDGQNRELNDPGRALLNRLFGTYDDYEAMRAGSLDAIQRIDARLALLESEKMQLAAQVNAPDVPSELGKLLDQPPSALKTMGDPEALKNYWHDQRGTKGDAYACALYAQASVMEAIGGHDFKTELAEARALGVKDGWFTASSGATGLGQPFDANNIPYEQYGWDQDVTREAALDKLESELQAGHYPVVNVDATKLSAYKGEPVAGHSMWVTGVKTDADGYTTAIIVNDSYKGAAVEYPVDEFMDAWGSRFNYYSVFARD